MIQKEVADRIIAKFNTSNYGRLSIISNWKLNIKKIYDIKPSAFYPKPKINSSILEFNFKKKIKNVCNEEAFIKLIRNCFNQSWCDQSL